MIRIEKETAKLIKKKAITKSESYDEILLRVLKNAKN
jgi:hypothetical protein